MVFENTEKSDGNEFDLHQLTLQKFRVKHFGGELPPDEAIIEAMVEWKARGYLRTNIPNQKGTEMIVFTQASLEAAWKIPRFADQAREKMPEKVIKHGTNGEHARVQEAMRQVTAPTPAVVRVPSLPPQTPSMRTSHVKAPIQYPPKPARYAVPPPGDGRAPLLKPDPQENDMEVMLDGLPEHIVTVLLDAGLEETIQVFGHAYRGTEKVQMPAAVAKRFGGVLHALSKNNGDVEQLKAHFPGVSWGYAEHVSKK